MFLHLGFYGKGTWGRIASSFGDMDYVLTLNTGWDTSPAGLSGGGSPGVVLLLDRGFGVRVGGVQALGLVLGQYKDK